jgi:hypothetical protein
MYNKAIFKLVGVYSLTHYTFLHDIKVIFLCVKHELNIHYFKGIYLAAKPRGVMVII